jgi:DNA-binding transcriptional MerR regulator
MPHVDDSLSPAQAARRLGVTAKALRLYEAHGLISPLRTAAGWRVYDPLALARAARVVALRRFGFGLAALARLLDAPPDALAAALAAQQASHEARIRQLGELAAHIQAARASLAQAQADGAAEVLAQAEPRAPIAFDLPWPWAGERFETSALAALTFITGPLGSGKTRLARRLAEAAVGARFLGLERKSAPVAPALAARIAPALEGLCNSGAVRSDALIALLAALDGDDGGALVIDLVEDDLDAPTQAALMAHLRARGRRARPIVLLTRSDVILDLTAVGPDEAIFYCPANHSPPIRVAPHRGAPGYEALEGCLASPQARARTAGLVAIMAA